MCSAYQDPLSLCPRVSPSVPSAADRARSRRRMDSLISGSGSSSDPREESDCDLLAPVPISYVSGAPPLVGPASSVVEDDLADWRRRYSLPSFVDLRMPTSGSALPPILQGRSPFMRLSLIPASGGWSLCWSSACAFFLRFHLPS
ncbi:hypothetical protein Bca4012_084002 [Brassica carinata]